MSDLADPKERALFMILCEHDVHIEGRREPRREVRDDGSRVWVWPDCSDIHIKTRKRIRELFENDVYPEDLLT